MKRRQFINVSLLSATAVAFFGEEALKSKGAIEGIWLKSDMFFAPDQKLFPKTVLIQTDPVLYNIVMFEKSHMRGYIASKRPGEWFVARIRKDEDIYKCRDQKCYLLCSARPEDDQV